MTIHRTRTVAGALLAVSTLATGLTAGAAQADGSSSERATVASAPVPAPGSWAVGYSAVVRSSTQSSAGHLEVYSPGGALVRRFATSTTGSVQDVSHDARLVLTAERHGTGTAFRLWDVAAGSPIEWFKLPGEAKAFFANGRILTTEEGASGTTRTTLRSTTGEWLRTLPALPGARGTQVSPGGTLLMQGTSSGVALRRSSEGRVVRTIPRPAGMTSCSPLGLWGQGYVKMMCEAGALGSQRVYAVSTSTGRQIPVTPESFTNAWPTSGRRTVAPAGGAGDQVGSVVNGRFVSYFKSASNEVTGAHGPELFLYDRDRGQLKRYDVQDGASWAVTGSGSVHGGYVQSARTVDTVN